MTCPDTITRKVTWKHVISKQHKIILQDIQGQSAIFWYRQSVLYVSFFYLPAQILWENILISAGTT